MPITFTRRRALELGLASAVGALWARSVRGEPTPPPKRCVLLYMEGGPSQLDTWDPKPGTPTGGEFRAIPTSVAGIQVCEHLPRLAARMKHLAVLRTVTTREGNHVRARHLMHTGYPPQGGADHPALGSLVAMERGRSELPGYVVIGGAGEDAGFLGAAYAPFPVRNPDKPVRYLTPPDNVDNARFRERMGLWRTLHDGFAETHSSSWVKGQGEVVEQGLAMMRSPRVRAFSLDEEPARARERYGDTTFGRGCLMARRLLEAGVPFVEVTQRGWDTHKENFPTVKHLCQELDLGMSALLDDLDARGLLSSTLVLWLGDFGRTPRINDNGGRDHHPQVSSVVMAGGGIRGGQAVGNTSSTGEEIRDRTITVPDVFRTVAHVLGLDPDKTRYTPEGRPIDTVDGGALIHELL
ncbi:MAG: DUF1501 domain-containing protein [Myxococcota bacterium]